MTAAVVERMAGFVAHLRLNGFALGPRETEAALRALAGMDGLDGPRARLGLKTVLAGRREEWERFDPLFEAYWFGSGRERAAARPVQGGGSGAARRLWDDHLGRTPPRRAGLGRMRAGEEEATAARSEGLPAASGRSIDARTDLREIADAQEMAEMEEIAFRLARALRFRLSRRWRIGNGGRLDLRRTIRRSLSRGGEPIELVTRRRPLRPVRLVVLLDVSGSMKPYARVFLQFVRGLVSSMLEAEAFLFHTRLLKVSDAMREADPMRAMTRLSLMAEGFGGGTRIGEALALFNDVHAAKSLNSRTAVLIMSDGYDTGTPEALVRELARLRRKAPRVVWLNPLARQQAGGEAARAMMAAHPWLDACLPAATVEDLAVLERALASL